MCLFYYGWFLFNIAQLNQNMVQLIRYQLLMLHNYGSREICLSIKNFVQCSLVKSESWGTERGALSLWIPPPSPICLKYIHFWGDIKYLQVDLDS